MKPPSAHWIYELRFSGGAGSNAIQASRVATAIHTTKITSPFGSRDRIGGLSSIGCIIPEPLYEIVADIFAERVGIG